MNNSYNKPPKRGFIENLMGSFVLAYIIPFYGSNFTI